MSGQPPPAPPADTPETTSLLLATFAELYRHEVAAEEDVHRTLPFFGTALGIVIAALAYAAGRLPRLPDLTSQRAWIAFAAASTLLGLAMFEAACVLLWLSRAIARRDYKRVGPESVMRDRLAALAAYYDARGVTGDARDSELLREMRKGLVESYAAVTPVNRALNQRRTNLRALAASHLVRSLIWAIGATSLIFATDKLGYLPKVIQ